MADVAKLTETVERLTVISDALLTLIQENRIASDRPPAGKFEQRWLDTKKLIEELQVSLRGDIVKCCGRS